MVDEAQWLNRDFEYFRHLHDDPVTRFGLLFVGGAGCSQVLHREPMLDSLVYAHLRFAPLTPTQVLQVIPVDHSVYAGVDRSLISLVDRRCARGNAVTVTVNELSLHTSRDRPGSVATTPVPSHVPPSRRRLRADLRPCCRRSADDHDGTIAPTGATRGGMASEEPCLDVGLPGGRVHCRLSHLPLVDDASVAMSCVGAQQIGRVDGTSRGDLNQGSGILVRGRHISPLHVAVAHQAGRAPGGEPTIGV